MNSAATGLVLFVALLPLGRTEAATKVLEEIVEQKHAVDRDAILSIRNTDGSVRVYGGNVPEITIRAAKRAYTAERLRSIVVDVKATRTSVAIETIFPPQQNAWSDRSGRVEYTIIVPETIRITKLDLVNGEVMVKDLRGGSATAHLVNGWLGGVNCFGDLNLSIVNGRLDVAYDWWENHKFSAKASSVNGALRAILPSHGAVALSARTGTGWILDLLGPKPHLVGAPLRVLETATGPQPESSIEMKTTSGNIRIEKSY
ncbi:MAG TPA: hypothetical protein VGW39_08205 [Chthoniobacterales bacterium]|nr:hypothetical protein [Chthoniobacterales bacterium]